MRENNYNERSRDKINSQTIKVEHRKGIIQYKKLISGKNLGYSYLRKCVHIIVYILAINFVFYHSCVNMIK